MNLIATLNLGSFLRPNVRASHLAAAHRWGCDYVTIDRPYGDRADLFGAKLQLFYKYPWPDGCRVLYIDGDALIRSDCPDPFAIVPEKCLGIVENNQTNNPDVDKLQRSYWERLAPPECGYLSSWYFNTGVAVFTPSHHHRVFARANALVAPTGVVGGMEEQTAENIAARLCDTPVLFMGHQFNRMVQEVYDASPEMPGYIVHYASCGRIRCERKNPYLDNARWEV